MISVDFNLESESSVRGRLTSGYRGRRNFLVYELFSLIVYQTPYKTGLARGNWRITVGQRPSGAIDRKDEGEGVIISEISSLKGSSVFANIFISNNLHYIEDLEEGSSGQAPSGILRVVVPAFRAMNQDAL